MSADQIQAMASLLTFLAAALAVWAAFRAPKLAAKFAEDLRILNQKFEEERRLKLWIFTTLMQNRRQIPNAVPALNLIDVVFCDSNEVREGWKHFNASTSESPLSSEKVVERYLSLIEKMSRDLGLSDKITISDIQLSYYPTALGQIDEAAYWELQEKLQRYRPPNMPGEVEKGGSR